MTRNVLIFVVGLAGLAFCWSCGSTASNIAVNVTRNTANTASSTNVQTGANSATGSAPAVRKAEITTTADALFKEYKTNIKTMEKYEGKVVEISGQFSHTSGSENSIDVKFETGDPLKVSCRVNASAIQAVAKFEKGEQIKMTGIGDPTGIIGPLFKDCQIAQ